MRAHLDPFAHQNLCSWHFKVWRFQIWRGAAETCRGVGVGVGGGGEQHHGMLLWREPPPPPWVHQQTGQNLRKHRYTTGIPCTQAEMSTASAAGNTNTGNILTPENIPIVEGKRIMTTECSSFKTIAQHLRCVIQPELVQLLDILNGNCAPKFVSEIGTVC